MEHLSWNQKYLQTHDGLSDQVVKNQRALYGENTEPQFPLFRPLSIFTTIFSVFNILMSGIIILLFWYHQNEIAQFIGIITLINTLIQLFQEIRARFILHKLTKTVEKTILAIRNGTLTSIPYKDLVIGDTLFLLPGDKVPTDGTITEGFYPQFDESILTGESKEITKANGEEIKAGSFLVSGGCFYTVTQLSKNSYMQKIARQVTHSRISNSPLQSHINHIISILTYVTLLFIILLSISGWVRHVEREIIIVNAAAIISAFVPQGLVLISTLSFTYGAIEIAKGHAIVQRLSSIESMANANVLCLDKTGTLTRNQLVVEKAVWKTQH